MAIGSYPRLDRIQPNTQPGQSRIRAHWWLDLERQGVMYAVGARGEVITVDPDHDLVIVQLATVGGPRILDHTESILGAFAALDQTS